jgi:two-component system phosphate regulon response regulator PhoB
MPQKRILIVGNDEDIHTNFFNNLSKEGFRVTTTGNREDAIKKVFKDFFDCILLDHDLFGNESIELCRWWKKDPKAKQIPVVMITSKGSETDILAGLRLGIDDYIIKPFNPDILIARIQLILRNRRMSIYNDQEILIAKEIEIHPGKHDVIYNGKHIDLTLMEFQVLHLLSSHSGVVFSRSQIVDNVRSSDYQPTDRSVDVVIVGIRRKLGEAGKYIETVRRVGYRFIEC